MNDPLYREIILENFEHPQNYGVVKNANAEKTSVNELCGDKIHISARIVNKKIAEIAWEGEGCAIARAAASILTGETEGQPVVKIKKMTSEAFLKKMGITLTPARRKCALLGFATLQEAIK